MAAVSRSQSVDVERLLDEGNTSTYQKFVVALVAVAIILDGIDNQLLGIAIPSIMRDWSLPRQAFANVGALGFLGMFVGGSLAGVVGDRAGRRTALIASVLMFAATTLAVSLVNSITTLGWLRLLVGIGLGGAIPTAATLSSEFVPRRHRPLAVTSTIVCVPLGGMLAGLVAQPLLPAVGWRGLFMVGGAVPLLVALLLIWLLPESPRLLARRPNRWPELFRTLRRAGHTVDDAAAVVLVDEHRVTRASLSSLLMPSFLRDTLGLWTAYFSCMLAVYLGFTWVPSMLTGAGLESLANLGIATFNLGGVVGAVLGSLFIFRFGSRVTLASMAAGTVVCALIMRTMTLAAGVETAPIVFMLAATGGLINAVQATLYALAAHVYPTVMRSTGVGFATAVGRAGAILSTYAGAWALDAGGSPAFFAVVAGAMLVAGVSISLIRRHVPPPR